MPPGYPGFTFSETLFLLVSDIARKLPINISLFLHYVTTSYLKYILMLFGISDNICQFIYVNLLIEKDLIIYYSGQQCKYTICKQKPLNCGMAA